MQYIEKVNNVEKVYNVFVDEEKLSELLNKIVCNINYEVEGTYTLPYNARVDYKKKIVISGADLPNGMPSFKNIKRIYPCDPNDSYSYYSGLIALEGTIVIVPCLAYLIKKILRKEITSIGNFLDYQNNAELLSIDDKIQLLDNQINQMDNMNPGKKIELLTELKKLLDDKEQKHYFDTELLKTYYQEAYSYIELQLVSEKTTMDDSIKILLKNLK